MLLRGRYPHTCGRDEARPSFILTSNRFKSTIHQPPITIPIFIFSGCLVRGS